MILEAKVHNTVVLEEENNKVNKTTTILLAP